MARRNQDRVGRLLTTTVGASGRTGRPLMAWAGAAEYLGTSERHMKYLVETKRVPHVKVGGLVKFDPDQLDTWILEQTVEVAG